MRRSVWNVCLFSLFLIATTMIPGIAQGKDFEKALVNNTINKVLYFDELKSDAEPRPAQPGEDIVGPNDALRTGPNSRAELVFEDGSMVRLGADAMFSIHPKGREIQMGEGSALFQVPKNSDKTTIRSATATASLTGTTVMFDQQPGKYSKSIVVEGSMNISIPDRAGEEMSLEAGQMVIIPAGAERLPDPVEIDLEELVETSGLISFDEESEEESDGEIEPTSPPNKRKTTARKIKPRKNPAIRIRSTNNNWSRI